MIIHTPGSIKKMLRFDGTVDTINNKSVFIITYKDREFSSKSDMYNATTISDGPKPNSAKMLDIMKYIKFIGCESEYILIIDCDDVYLDNNTLSDMICDSKHDIFISSYDSFTRGRGFLNSGVIFGKRDAIVALASIYIDIYDINTKYGITHSYDEWLIGAAVLCLSRKYSISTSEDEALIPVTEEIKTDKWYGVIINFGDNFSVDLYTTVDDKLTRISSVDNITNEIYESIEIENYYINSSNGNITNIRLYNSFNKEIDKQLTDLVSYNIRNDHNAIINDSADTYLNKEYKGRQR